MQKQTNRLIVATVLIAAGVIGGFFVVAAHRRMAGIDAASNDVATRIDRLITTAGDIASAQQAYVAPGQPDEPWLDRGARLLQQFGQDAMAIRPLLQSTEAAAALDGVEKGFTSIVIIDRRAREDLQEAQNLLAADLIFSEGHDTVSGLVMALRSLAASEQRTFAARRATVERQRWEAVGAVAIVWLVGLIMMVSMPGSGIGGPGSVTREPSDPGSRIPDSQAASLDLAAAAGVCDALARTTDTGAVREALARAAAVLDARGIIVWIGAGEELFPVLSHGYDGRVIERLGPIPRNAANVTAEAWRTAQMRTVVSDAGSNGALAAPVIGVNGCVGVLAAEVRNGREDDPAVRAVAAMFAAQLAAIVPVWPAASGAPEQPLAASHG